MEEQENLKAQAQAQRETEREQQEQERRDVMEEQNRLQEQVKMPEFGKYVFLSKLQFLWIAKFMKLRISVMT